MPIAVQERTCVLPSPDALPANDEPCVQAVRRVLDRVADKWSLYVIAALRDRPLRFNDIERAVPGISHRMLSLTLRALERDGLVTRTVIAVVPRSVSYALTPLGAGLLVPVMGLVNWVSENRVAVEAAREAFEKRATPDELPAGVRRITFAARTQ
jgi:DNA-binding HxlR family transcriptional regulator